MAASVRPADASSPALAERESNPENSRREPSVLLLQTTIPFYRIAPLQALAARLDGGLTVLAGDRYFDPTITLAPMSDLPMVRVRNTFLGGRRVLWQSGVWRRSLRAEVVIAELNPRSLSTWWVLATRRALGRPTVLWGHAWSRGGRRSGSDRVRHVMRRLAAAIVAYSETQAAELRAQMPDHCILAAPNSLYRRTQQPLLLDGGKMCNFLFVGRLVHAKKPMVALESFIAAADDLPAETNLVFIGTGPLERELVERANRSPLRHRIRFAGEVTDLHSLAGLYADALASIVPGCGGLSLIQSLWFGVPNVIARGEPHGPEIEAATPGRDALFFESDSVDALRRALIQIAMDRDIWIRRRQTIAHACARRYSVEAMVDQLEDVVHRVSG